MQAAIEREKFSGAPLDKRKKFARGRAIEKEAAAFREEVITGLSANEIWLDRNENNDSVLRQGLALYTLSSSSSSARTLRLKMSSDP